MPDASASRASWNLAKHIDNKHLTTTANLDPAILEFLHRAGLAIPGEVRQFAPLTGGVSSDIWLVRTDSNTFCVKRALDRLRVAAEWRAPVTRNTSEVAWLRHVARLNPDWVPAVLASDAALGMFAMEYLPPDQYELWKARLARGVVNEETAAIVGRTLVSVHNAFAASSTAAAEFDTGDAFHALRIEPYLLATARVHSDLAPALESLAERTERTKLTVVHGDISPKNILLGSRGPVFLDAECAWWGDPAFDLAFCLNHLLLKTVWVPTAEKALLSSFEALSQAYLRNVSWEPAANVESRTASLLPGLLLARIDGKSPVEYLTREAEKDQVRRAARSMLSNVSRTLNDVRRKWADRLRPTPNA